MEEWLKTNPSPRGGDPKSFTALEEMAKVALGGMDLENREDPDSEPEDNDIAGEGSS